MSETSSYLDEGAMEKTSLERSLRQYAWTQKFGLGTIWWVGEGLWQEMLPQRYVPRQDPKKPNHPGMCVAVSCDCLHATMPMWYGTHNECRPGFSVHLDGAENAPTYFGHFRAVQINRAFLAFPENNPNEFSKKQKRAWLKYERYHVLPYEKKPRLKADELAKLKHFIKENLMLVGVSA